MPRDVYMIPTEEQAKKLWDKYNLPQRKRQHVTLVAKVALFFVERMSALTHQPINASLLRAAALLHDIDKNVPKLPGERHPDAGVRILREEGMEEVASLVKTHPLHAILDPAISPKTIEEKLLFLADKMVKYEVIGLDERFRLWNEEHVPAEEQQVLDAAYPKVKDLQRDVRNLIGIDEKRILEEFKGGEA